ncbi:MAG: hypothetical protein JNK53_06535, partial [Phycisphaerae bacterium]|nr:hypothetical protein [Phycisphaerae bacterium]
MTKHEFWRGSRFAVRGSRFVLSLGTLCVLTMSASAQEACVKPYRAFWIDDLDPEPMTAVFSDATERNFPRGAMRYHINESRIIAGTALVTRTVGSTPQALHRASVWRYAPGGVGSLPSGWKRFPLVPEPGGPTEPLEQFETLVGALNEASVVGGGRAWDVQFPQRIAPAAWTVDPASGAVLSSVRLGAATQVGENGIYYRKNGWVTALGPGLTPLAGGWMQVRCGDTRPAPILSSLVGAGPDYPIAEVAQIYGDNFPAAYPPIGRLTAIPLASGGQPCLLGWVRDGFCSGLQVGLCVSNPNFNSWAALWLQVDGVWTASPVARPMAGEMGFHFELYESTQTLGCGYIRHFASPSPGLAECHDHAAVFVDPTAPIGPFDLTNPALDIHGALLAEDQATWPRSRAAAVSDSATKGFDWWVVGSAYWAADDLEQSSAVYRLARGVVWQGRYDGESLDARWCGRLMETLACSFPGNLALNSLPDVAPRGAAIGVG